MARYQIPSDPRKGSTSTENRRVGRRPSPPWLWIGLGAIVTVLAIAVAVLWARLLLDVKPEAVDETPTPIIQTAVPTSAIPTPTIMEATPTTATEEGTALPEETSMPTEAPLGVIAIGVRVIVEGTEGAGVSLRAGPGTDNARLAIANDGDILEIVDGPHIGASYVWWLVKTADGTEGWTVEDFLRLP